MHAPARNFGADRRRSNHFALAFFKQQNRHALVDIVAGDGLKLACAFAIELQIYRGAVRLLIKARAGICQVVAREQHFFFQDVDKAFAVAVGLAHKDFAAQWHGCPLRFGLGLVWRKNSQIAVALGGMCFGAFINHADFKRSRAPQNFFGFSCVLHARELHHHAVRALLLDDGLSHAQLVDAVVQRQNVLFNGGFLELAGISRFEAGC